MEKKRKFPKISLLCTWIKWNCKQKNIKNTAMQEQSNVLFRVFCEKKKEIYSKITSVGIKSNRWAFGGNDHFISSVIERTVCCDEWFMDGTKGSLLLKCWNTIKLGENMSTAWKYSYCRIFIMFFSLTWMPDIQEMQMDLYSSWMPQIVICVKFGLRVEVVPCFGNPNWNHCAEKKYIYEYAWLKIRVRFNLDSDL